MLLYINNELNIINLMKQNNNYTFIDLLNDNNHIINIHIKNNDYNFIKIYNLLGIKCNNYKKCKYLLRNYRIRINEENENKNNNNLFLCNNNNIHFYEILDEIHSFYFHTEDIGNIVRINNEIINPSILNDEEKQILFKKRENILIKKRINFINIINNLVLVMKKKIHYLLMVLMMMMFMMMMFMMMKIMNYMI